MSSASLSAAIQKAVTKVSLAKPVIRGKATVPSRITRIRDRHHQMARMVAAGVPEEQICSVMGITESGLALLTEQTPAFIELVAYYRPRVNAGIAKVATYLDILNANMLATELALRDKLMEEADDMSASVLNKLSMDRADRLGYGKQSLNLNVNVDLATRLEARARKRKSSPPATVGDGGASSHVAEQGSAPPLLELKAEPQATEPPTNIPARVAQTNPATPVARPPDWEHPVAAKNREKYGPKGHEPIDRRI
ncbi:MAG: hypothetical protein LAO23_19590 [Acidobacteriia bacterium]|nr:hypothetical protein [Terriglobia bacterium]